MKPHIQRTRTGWWLCARTGFQYQNPCAYVDETPVAAYNGWVGAVMGGTTLPAFEPDRPQRVARLDGIDYQCLLYQPRKWQCGNCQTSIGFQTRKCSGCNAQILTYGPTGADLFNLPDQPRRYPKHPIITDRRWM